MDRMIHRQVKETAALVVSHVHELNMPVVLSIFHDHIPRVRRYPDE